MQSEKNCDIIGVLAQEMKKRQVNKRFVIASLTLAFSSVVVLIVFVFRNIGFEIDLASSYHCFYLIIAGLFLLAGYFGFRSRSKILAVLSILFLLFAANAVFFFVKFLIIFPITGRVYLL